jgi:hypothetical protein
VASRGVPGIFARPSCAQARSSPMPTNPCRFIGIPTSRSVASAWEASIRVCRQDVARRVERQRGGRDGRLTSPHAPAMLCHPSINRGWHRQDDLTVRGPPIRLAGLIRRPINARIGGCGEIAQLVEHSTENRGVGGSSPPLAIRRTGPTSVWAGDAPLPAQTHRNPQETNGMSGIPRPANGLQIRYFR